MKCSLINKNSNCQQIEMKKHFAVCGMCISLTMHSVFVLKVMGLVTRKDLARYHLGKHGLEEMDLAHP